MSGCVFPQRAICGGQGPLLFFASEGLLRTRMVPAIGLPIVAALTCYLFVFVQTYFALHCL
ncbi:MAG: hypothetical protein EBT36_02090 [Betaproteobacteria bacterium]|nr:hypothetical protein [Betaproteobacteria bacterium]NBY55879.1 hypothetical protein [Betaproteobacteria bacterium]NDC84237.1 hypothetical protein [Betaproteobacteria bacterium]NDG80436.1 hypothetical protein [Betaproteobacteria bacterium]